MRKWGIPLDRLEVYPKPVRGYTPRELGVIPQGAKRVYPKFGISGESRF